MACCFGCVASVIGLVVMLKWLVGFVGFVRTYFLRGSSTFSQYKDAGADNWAVVTGSSEGIGKAYAIALAKRGFNLCLYALGEEQLHNLSEKLKSEYGVKVIYREVNFVTAPQSTWDEIRKTLSELNIAVLVNNAGCVNFLPGFLDEVPREEIERMLMVNIHATVTFSHMLAKQMSTRKHRSAIISMSSFTSLTPAPMLQVYGATKAFVKHFSSSLAVEYKGKIDVMSVAPWWVVTEMTKIRKASFTAITPEHLVEATFAQVGTTCHTDPYWVHAVMDLVVKSLPEGLVTRNIIKQQKFVRSRLMLRKQKAEEEKAKKN
eukprot:TRINITY_DN7022_c0_g1_i1.p2 TRINITY_DN7022_c0_g1~~TRINITY_DN7022_c0_g1_i1.p2  ORF type:complete len:319 (+),score=101.51 TRINITY_DN7022_c0_g1_i1:34-990(+)